MSEPQRIEWNGYYVIQSRPWISVELDFPELITFWKFWWGAKNKKAQMYANTTHVIFQTSIWEDIGLLSQTNGVLFIRQEHIRLYDRILAHFQHVKDPPGLVVTGQPGLGKSYTLAILAVFCMAEERPFLLSTNSKQTYLFLGNGVYTMPSASVVANNLLKRRDLELPTPWSLIDSGSDLNEPNDALTLCPKVFPIQAASPNESRFKSWLNRNSALKLVMDVWDLDELKSGVRLHKDCRRVTDQAIEEAYKNSGPCPRDITDYLTQQRAYEEKRRSALSGLDSSSDLLSMIEAAKSNASPVPHKTCHRLFIVRRSVDIEPNDSGDLAYVDFKNESIELELRSKFDLLEFKEAVKLWRACLPSSESSVLAGWIFENICIRIISSHSSAPAEPFRSFRRMTQILHDEKSRYSDASATAKRTVIYDSENRSAKIVASDQTGKVLVVFSGQQPPLKQFPVSTRLIKKINVGEIEHLSFECGVVYLTLARNNPLFDAVFVEEIGNDEAHLWVLQFTVAKFHGGSVKGIQIVESIFQTLKKKWPNKRLFTKWVLMVPEQQNRAVQWDLPARWEDSIVRGEVYSQYVSA